MSGRDETREMADGQDASLAAVPESTRGGEDARRRGWFWHWNSLVTQYAPLIGLKGVGLLNSYTVWTDRREESPHRGYAFPSQQREADFYGEDRAELITINKILVALDLIEIRKEMVVRADAQGRRWKVPHNFYRVKDHDDSFSLSTGDVLKVADLAERDRAVYRYLRRVFSPKFAPIDEGNVWARILPEVRQTAVWQRLSTRAEAEERRASDRTRAGHAARKGAAPVESGEPVSLVPEPGDTPAGARVDSDSAAVDISMGEETFVAPVNGGSDAGVAPANDGLTLIGVTGVGPANAAAPTSVDPANTTYHQDVQTTTTTGGGRLSTIPDLSAVAGPIRRQGGPSDSAPDDAPGRAAAIRAFEAANDRTATPAERTLLAQLAERFLPAASAAGASGWAWTEAAIFEAVEAGSRYVAPRRIREILLRWEREGFPQSADDAGRDRIADNPRAGSAGPGVALPGGLDAGRAWAATIDALAGAMDGDALRDLTAGTSICGCAGGVVTVAAADAAQADRLAGYAGLIARKLSGVLRRDVEVRVLAGDGPAPDDGPRRSRRQPAVAAPDREMAPATFMVAECGMPSGPVWSAIVAEACAGGGASTAEAEVWLKPTVLLGRGGSGGEGSPLVVGATSAMARRRLETRHRAARAGAAAAVLGRPVGLEFVVAREWLARRDEEAAGA